MTIAVKVNANLRVPLMLTFSNKRWCAILLEKDVHLLCEDVQSLEESDDKVRVVNSDILI